MDATPTHSKLGNPYPRGLPPVVIDPYRGVARGPLQPEPLTGCRRAPLRFVTPRPHHPDLPFFPPPRQHGQTDAEWEATVRDSERFHVDVTVVMLHAMRLLATHLGNPASCAEGACRRRRRCCGLRDPFTFGLNLAVLPPCVPPDEEIMWTYFEEVRRELRHLVAGAKAPGGADAEG
ncbi:MAG: hypothetical protein KF723_08500 [Rhizobiaceae bacterium]|nr:hypothetical protein [Rhizobiaceae bacterium]